MIGKGLPTRGKTCKILKNPNQSGVVTLSICVKKDEILRSLQIIDVEGTYMKHKEGFTSTVDEFEIKILGDGNCFFRSISQALTDSEPSHEFMRRSITEHMASNIEMYKNYIDGDSKIHLRNICKTDVRYDSWATEA